MSLRIFLIRLIKIRLCECRCSNKGASYGAAQVDKEFSGLHTCKCSTNSSTSRRFSEEIRSEPLWAPLYWNSSDSRERLRRLFEQSDEFQYSGAHNGSERVSSENRRDVLESVEHLLV